MEVDISQVTERKVTGADYQRFFRFFLLGSSLCLSAVSLSALFFVCFEFSQDVGTGRIDNIFSRIKQGCYGVVFAETVGFVGEILHPERAVVPRDIDPAGCVFGAVIGTTPWRFWSEVEIAFSTVSPLPYERVS